MLKRGMTYVVAFAAMIAAGCAHGLESSAAGEIDPAEAAKTVLLHVENQNVQSMELRTVIDGRSTFVGSVSGSDTTSILLDPSNFPAGFLYVVAIPADGHGRAIAGPLSASKGDKITFNVSPLLSASRAFVSR